MTVTRADDRAPVRAREPVPGRPVRPDIAVAVLFGWLSLTPSLLPRTWLLQGAVSGLAAANGYVVGLVVHRLLRRFGDWRPPTPLWRIVVGLGGIGTVLALHQGRVWQLRLHAALGQPAPGPVSWLAVPVLAMAVVAVLVGGCRLLRRLGRVAGPGVLPVTAGLVVALAVLVVPPGGLLGVADTVAGDLDGVPARLAAPRSTVRSGGPASLVPWSSLGRQGRLFVTRGDPRAVRVYIGLDTAADPHARADRAVAELDRAGAFRRKVLCVVIPTGTGWVDEPTVAALEKLYRGDSALVAQQYSYLPSWLSFVAAPDQARVAARALYAAVYRRWSALPAATRPKLLVYGHSLGAYGGPAAFDRALGRPDGALFTGPPRGTGWLRSGQVRYLRHDRDPVVRWSARVLLAPPDLPRHGPPVTWLPFVTFWQLTGDMLVALDVPPAFGHDYGPEAPAVWASLAPPPPGTR